MNYDVLNPPRAGEGDHAQRGGGAHPQALVDPIAPTPLPEITPRDLVLASAQSAADAAADMLRVAREGETALDMAFDDMTLLNLTDAVATIAMLEAEHATLASDKEALGQLAHACRNFQIDFSR